ncbi:glycoside hydrolase [Dysgonomonas sp. OttesenSCG-928-M03]|nr:glycoside hydrolase [Dysgonomonas sp. OttesenSCG-928-M03]
MKTRFLLSALCITGLLFSCSDAEQFEVPDVNANLRVATTVASGVTVQWGQEQQNIDGFGICQGHADDLYSHYKRSEIMNWLYGNQGLRLNIFRGELSTHFSPSQGVYDFGFDRNIDIPFDDPLFDAVSNSNHPSAVELYIRAQQWVLREAKQIHNVEKIIFSAWSPPLYMKSNNGDAKGFLKFSQYQNYANYIALFVKQFQDHGYPIYGVSPANEPEYAAGWTSCLWLPGSTTLGPFVVKNLGPTLQREGLNTRIIFGENAQWTGILGFILGSKSYTTNIINLNPKIKNFNVIAAGHGYVDPITKKRPAIEPFTKALQKNIPVWLTEVSSIDYDNIRWDIEDGLNWAADWHRYLSDASTSALIYWLGAVPGVNDEGLIYMNDRNNYTLTKRFETFGNFSRYIKPDSRRITIDRGNGLPTDFHISSYKKDNEMVIVMVNKTDEHVTTPLNINGVQGINSLKRVLTDADNRWAETAVIPQNGQYTLDIPAKSTVTFVGTVQ